MTIVDSLIAICRCSSVRTACSPSIRRNNFRG